MDKERVVIELTPEGRLRLAIQLYERMVKEFGTELYSDLDLGFPLNEAWPLEGEILISQLVVLACKLKMQIVIGDINLSLMPEKIKTTTGQTVEITG